MSWGNFNMIYIVTGTPGTGKTTFAKKIALEKNLKYFDGNEIIKNNSLSEGFDEKNNCTIVDEKKFSEVCEKLIENEKKDLIIDSHLSHYISSNLVDVCYVIECDIKELQKRLEKRGYSKQKIKDNIDSEIFKVCRSDAKEFGHNIEIIDTT